MSPVPDDVADTIKRIHPGGVFGDPDDGLYDRYLSPHVLSGMVSSLRDRLDVTIDIETNVPLGERSRTLYLGRHEAPSWVSFNRVMSDSERQALTSDSKAPLIYGVVRLSRMAPYYLPFWNQFRSTGNRVMPVEIETPTTFNWAYLWSECTKQFHQLGYRELPRTVADQTVEWLTSSSGTHPTVYECIISSSY